MRHIACTLALLFVLPAVGGCYRNVDSPDYRIPRRVADAGKGVLDNPNDAEAWLRLGDAYRSARRVDEAYQAYQQASQLKPGDKTIESRLAGLTEHRPLSVAEEAVLNNPTDDEAWGDLGDEYRAAGREEEALDAYRRAAMLDPADGEWQNNLIEAGVDLDELISAWLTQLPDDDERIGDLADALVERGRFEEALQLYRRAHEIDPDDTEWTNNIATYGGGGPMPPTGVEGDGGIAAVLGTGGVPTGDDEAIGDMADSYAQQGNRELALQHYRRALELDPTDAEWQNKLAIYAGAASLSDFMEGRLSADPRNDEVMGQLAQLYAQMGHTQRALDLFRDALAIDPADGQWQGKVSLLGGMDMTRTILEEKLAADPNNDEVVGRLGDVAAFQGDRDKAVELYGRALTLDPGDEEWRESLQQIAGTDALLEVLEPLLGRVEDDEALGDLADIYAASGNTGKALELYRRAAAIDPEDSEWQGKIAIFGQ